LDPAKLQHYYDSASRRTDWAWQRAINIDESNDSPPTRVRDTPAGYAAIKLAMRFRSRLLSATGMADFRQLQEQFPNIYAAYSLFVSAGPDKCSLEANILTGRDLAEIALRCNMPFKAVQLYEQLFFNVRDKLDKPDYILHCVIRPLLLAGTTEMTIDMMWKIYAYYFGEHVLYAVQSTVTNPTRAQTMEGVGAAIRDDVVNTMCMQAAIAAKTLRVTDKNQLRVLDMFSSYLEIAKENSMAGRAQDTLMHAIQQMVEHLPIGIGRQALLVSHPNTKAYDHSAIELTVNELSHVTVHGDIPGRDEVLEMTFESVHAANASLIITQQQTG
jgi:hypothetical protein